MKNLSPEKIKEIKEKDKQVVRNEMQTILTTVEDFFPNVFNEANDPYYTDTAIFSNEKHYLTNPLYMQNVIIFIASCLQDTLLDSSELSLLMHCRVIAVDISYNSVANSDFLVVTFEYPNSNDIEQYRIAIECNVDESYVLF